MQLERKMIGQFLFVDTCLFSYRFDRYSHLGYAFSITDFFNIFTFDNHKSIFCAYSTNDAMICIAEHFEMNHTRLMSHVYPEVY